MRFISCMSFNPLWLWFYRETQLIVCEPVNQFLPCIGFSTIWVVQEQLCNGTRCAKKSHPRPCSSRWWFGSLGDLLEGWKKECMWDGLGWFFFEVWRGWKIGRIGESFLLKPREWIELFLPADWSEEEHQWCGLEVERGSTSPPNHENPHREGNHLLLLLLWYPWLGCILIIQVNARSDVFDVNNCGWLSDKIIRCKKCGT